MIHITSDTRPSEFGRFEREVRWILNHAFTNPDFFVVSETAKYRPSEDKDIWYQKRGLTNEIVEVYYKGEYVCDVHSNMSRDEIINKVNRIIILNAEVKRKEKERKEREK